MVVSVSKFLRATKSLSIELDNEFFINDFIGISYQNSTYYYKIIFRAVTVQNSFIYTLTPTFNTNFKL